MNRSTSGVGRISHSWQPLIRARNSFFSLIRSEGKLSTVHVSTVPHLKVQCIPHPKSALDGLRHPRQSRQVAWRQERARLGNVPTRETCIYHGWIGWISWFFRALRQNDGWVPMSFKCTAFLQISQLNQNRFSAVHLFILNFLLTYDGVWMHPALQALEPMRNCISVTYVTWVIMVPNHQIKIRNVFQWRGHILWTPPPSQAKKYKIKVRERVMSHTIKWYWWHLLGS